MPQRDGMVEGGLRMREARVFLPHSYDCWIGLSNIGEKESVSRVQECRDFPRQAEIEALEPPNRERDSHVNR